MLRLSLCVVLVFVIGCESAAERQIREAREAASRILAAARVSWKGGERTDALELFSKSIATYPTTTAYNARGNAYVLTDQDELAAKDVERGLAIDALNVDLLELRSLLKKRKADRDSQLAADRERARAEASQREEDERNRMRAEQAAADQQRQSAARARAQAAQDAFSRGWRELPTAIELPSAVSERVSIDLPGVPQGQAAYELQLSGDPEFALQHQTGRNDWVVMLGKKPVGVFALNAAKLNFTWDGSLGRTTDPLRFCSLKIHAAGQSHALSLRVPIKRPAVDISFAKDVTFESLPITDTAAEDLLLEFISIEGISGEAKLKRRQVQRTDACRAGSVDQRRGRRRIDGQGRQKEGPTGA